MVLPILVLLVMLALAILYCFWGYKYLKISMFLIAFFAGVYYSYNWLGSSVPTLGNWLWLISIAIGLLLAFLAFFFVKLAVFAAGGIIGLLIFDIVKRVQPAWFSSLEPLPLFLIGLTFFILVGLLTFASRKHFVILFSSVFGAYALVRTAGIVIGLFLNGGFGTGTTAITDYSGVFNSVSIFNNAPLWALVVPVIVFSIAGIITQYRYTARGKKA
ncbi:MAG: DUF4203 domain-containing protein [Christensenella sp.]|nr:DUF4203 domain-containing protein [Christensenella sp.]